MTAQLTRQCQISIYSHVVFPPMPMKLSCTVVFYARAFSAGINCWHCKGLSDLRDMGEYGPLPWKALHIYTYLISTEPFFLAKELRKFRKRWDHITYILLFVLKTMKSETSSQQRLQVFRKKMHGICNAMSISQFKN